MEHIIIRWFTYHTHDDVIKWKHFVIGSLSGEITVHRWIPRTKASYRELWCFLSFFLRPNKRLSKQSWGWWFETPSHPFWRHCNVHIILVISNIIWRVSCIVRGGHFTLLLWNSNADLSKKKQLPRYGRGVDSIEERFCERVIINEIFRWRITCTRGLFVYIIKRLIFISRSRQIWC